MEYIKECAFYCLNCKTKPCQKGCPLGNDIPAFIEKIRECDYEEAFRIIEKTSVLFSLCGKICPHSKQCQGKCVRGIKGEPVRIGELEAFIGKFVDKKGLSLYKSNIEKPYKIAIIGSGPAGLTAAAYLAKEGYTITIYEREEKLGGILRYGIPDFRLDRKTLDNTINRILNLGIEVKTNMELGKDISIKELKEKYNATFLAIGANLSHKMGIEGEELRNVFGGNELLRTSNHPNYCNKSVIVVGGGNVAMDTARTIKKLGAKDVKVVYRREETQMPAETKEIEQAKEEGIEFIYKTNVQRILGKERVEKIECVKTELIEKEGETRLYPVNVEGSEFYLQADYVIMAIGADLDKELVSALGINLNERKRIKVNENYMTNIEGVFAAGDLIGEKPTVAWASRSGREAAKSIITWLEQ